MPKRGATKDVLTGGSGDVNPQTLVINSATVGLGFTQGVVGLPIPRLPISEGQSIVMEITDVEFSAAAIAANLGTTQTYHFALTTDPSPTGVLSITNVMQNPRTVAQWLFQTTVAAAPTSFETIPLSQKIDMTDAAGHGILIATDNLFFNVGTNNAVASIISPSCRISYRFKQVSLREYIGIVQSQQ